MMSHIMPKAKPPIERFMAKVEQIPFHTCWEWTGTLNSSGYGWLWNGNKNQAAHRFSYEYFNGEISEKSLVCHKCDNPACVNPAHLFLGTDAANAKDKVKKGRQSRTNGMKAGKLCKLKDEDIFEIRKLRASGLSQQKIADRFGISQFAVSAILMKKRWGHI